MSNKNLINDQMLNDAADHVNKPRHPHSFHKLMSMKITGETMKDIQQGDFIFERLIKSSHITSIVAESGAGKTTIMTYAAAKMAANGFNVIYINMDASSADLAEYQIHADQHGYEIIAPDMHIGKSPGDVWKALEEIADGDDDSSETVVIIDTLKKLVDMINKTSIKQFMMIARRLTTRGATIILLGHLNKNIGVDGKKNYEGTGDLRADGDNLFYLDGIKNGDVITVSTRLDKNRAQATNTTFEIATDRTVTVSSKYINLMSMIERQKMREQDSPIIKFIQNSMPDEGINLTRLERLSKKAECGFSRSKIGTVLGRYSTDEADAVLWTSKKESNNALVYRAIKLTPSR